MADEVSKTIRYTGSAVRAGGLVQMLERRGVRVEWEPPREERGFGADLTAVALSLVASGAYDAIKAGVAQFRERFPHAEITIEDDDGGPDDGGF